MLITFGLLETVCTVTGVPAVVVVEVDDDDEAVLEFAIDWAWKFKMRIK